MASHRHVLRPTITTITGTVPPPILRIAIPDRISEQTGLTRPNQPRIEHHSRPAPSFASIIIPSSHLRLPPTEISHSCSIPSSLAITRELQQLKVTVPQNTSGIASPVSIVEQIPQSLTKIFQYSLRAETQSAAPLLLPNPTPFMMPSTTTPPTAFPTATAVRAPNNRTRISSVIRHGQSDALTTFHLQLLKAKVPLSTAKTTGSEGEEPHTNDPVLDSIVDAGVRGLNASCYDALLSDCGAKLQGQIEKAGVIEPNYLGWQVHVRD